MLSLWKHFPGSWVRSYSKFREAVVAAAVQASDDRIKRPFEAEAAGRSGLDPALLEGRRGADARGTGCVEWPLPRFEFTDSKLSP